ncbi:7085_t:CDS:2, partial [Entrophospora sp. SA101]
MSNKRNRNKAKTGQSPPTPASAKKKIDSSSSPSAMLIYTANMDVSTVLTPPSSPTCASQHYECAVCKILYKTKSGLMHHNTIVRKYNLKHEGLCRLPSEVITEFKAFLVHVIQSKLKGHFSQSVIDFFMNELHNSLDNNSPDNSSHIYNSEE